jgi:hypothetical protein
MFRPASRPRRSPPKAQPLPEWPAGTAVVLTDDDGRRYRTTTRSAPWMLGDMPVVLVEGIAGGYRCDRIEPGDVAGLPHFEDRKAVRAGTYVATEAVTQ